MNQDKQYYEYPETRQKKIDYPYRVWISTFVLTPIVASIYYGNSTTSLKAVSACFTMFFLSLVFSLKEK